MPHSLSIQDALSRLGAGFRSASAGIMLLRISAFFILLREAFIRLKNSPLCHGMAGRGVLLQFLCVNALSGLISFLLTNANIMNLTPHTVCQCPKRADFISTKYRAMVAKDIWVSMP